jgi:hypothetical protein
MLIHLSDCLENLFDVSKLHANATHSWSQADADPSFYQCHITSAHSFIMLGKLFLINKSLAGESLNVLERKLHQEVISDPANVSDDNGWFCIHGTILPTYISPLRQPVVIRRWKSCQG